MLPSCTRGRELVLRRGERAVVRWVRGLGQKGLAILLFLGACLGDVKRIVGEKP